MCVYMYIEHATTDSVVHDNTINNTINKHQTGDTVLMVTPMFHANSWGISFSGK